MRRFLRKVFRTRQRPRGDTRPRSHRPGVEVLEDRRLLSAGFLQTNLVSSVPGLADFTDTQLVNPWGLTTGGKGPFWVSDNQTGLSTLYNGQGAKLGLVVTIPSVPGNPFGHATPTGTVFNTDTNANDFQVTVPGGKPSRSIFLFDTLDGTIDGWNGNGTAAVKAPITTPAGAVYTGLAIDTSTTAGNTLLYAADWGTGTVEVYNGSFQQVDKGSFQDGAIPAGFRPFNVQDINGNIWVTYAQFDPMTGADTGTGGFVAEFTRDGALKQTLTGEGWFNSPWGIAMAPSNFGQFSNDLLVGNFGDGHISAFNPSNGNFLGQVTDTAGQPIAIENLWALRFGNGGSAGSTNTLFFTAGLKDDPATIFGADEGLLGSLQAVPSQSPQAPLVTNLQNAAFQTVSTVPTTNGDQNPYGVAIVPSDFRGHGVLQPGDILVSNFNNAGTKANPGGLQGQGSTIMRITPQGGTSVFFQGAPGLGLTTALGVLKNGFVLVGSLPTTYDSSGNPTIHPGALYVLDANGKVVETLTGSKLDSPWDLTVSDQGNFAKVFVSNVVSGTVTRLDLVIPRGVNAPLVRHETVIASGFKSEPNGPALILGPTGLAYDPRRDILYVASTADNAVFAIRDAGDTTKNQGTGKAIFQDPHLRGPLGLVLAPNGDLIAANGDAVNGDPTQPSELVEFTPQGKFVGQFSVDPGQGGAFGLAVTNDDDDGVLRLAAVDDNTNSLGIWTFREKGPDD